MGNSVHVGQPYREVCMGCGQRKQVVALHFPTDLAVGTVRSTRLCEECLAALTLHLLSAWSVFHPVNRR
jgi:hypothetical protein